MSNATQKWRMEFHMKSINKPVINYKTLYTIYLRHRKQLLSNEIYKYQRTTRSLVADILLLCLLSESSFRCHGTSRVLIQYLYLRQKAENTSITEAETKWPTLGKQYFPNHHLQWKLCGDGNKWASAPVMSLRRTGVNPLNEAILTEIRDTLRRL